MQKTAEQTASTDELDVSIVMPCLNEAEGVAECVRKALDWIERSRLKGEVVVVDNNSTDDSAMFAAEAGARVVAEKEPGYGAALRSGFRQARGRYMVMGDCDGTYDFSQLDALVGPLDEGYDLVMGNRLTDQLAPGAMPWAHRFIGTPLISWILRIFTGAKIRDSQCGLRAMRRDAIQSLGLRSPGMEFASEMILRAMRGGLKITEVPISYDVRAGESKLSTFRDGWRHLRFLLISSPSHAFLLPGLFLMLLGLFSLIVTVTANSGLAIGGVNWEPVFAASIFFVIGINVTMLGVLAKLLAFRTSGIESRVVDFYHKHLGLERLILASGLAILAGGLIDLVVLIEWLGGTDLYPNLLQWAAVAQALIVIGGNLLFAAIAAAMVDHDITPE